MAFEHPVGAVGERRYAQLAAEVVRLAGMLDGQAGVAGVLGDLAESLLKRDAGTKDAAKSIPGFGGVLDVIDSVLFAAPVAYLWFVW